MQQASMVSSSDIPVEACINIIYPICVITHYRSCASAGACGLFFDTSDLFNFYLILWRGKN